MTVQNTSITPGTGGLGFAPNPPVTVPEPTVSILILLGLLVLALLSMRLSMPKRSKRVCEHERMADKAIYSNNPKVDPLAKRGKR